MELFGNRYHEFMIPIEISEIIKQIPRPKLAGGDGHREEAEFNIEQSVAEALAEPLDYPTLDLAVLPDDQVCLVVEPEIRDGERISAAVVRALLQLGLPAENVVVLLAEGVDPENERQFRAELDRTGCQGCQLVVHQADDTSRMGFLGASLSGEPIALNARLVHSDFVIPIAHGRPDENESLFDFVYPSFSDLASQQRYYQLDPHDQAKLNREANRILGSIFRVSVCDSLSAGACLSSVPGRTLNAGNNRRQILIGEQESVQRSTRQWYADRGGAPQDVLQDSDRIMEPVDLLVALVGSPLIQTRDQVSRLVDRYREECSADGSILLIWDDRFRIPRFVDESACAVEVTDGATGMVDEANEQPLLTRSQQSVYFHTSQSLLIQSELGAEIDAVGIERLIQQHDQILVLGSLD